MGRPRLQWTALSVALLVLMVPLVSCGQDEPTFTASSACHVPTRTVSSVTGTKNFRLIESDESLPIGGDDTEPRVDIGQYVCRVVSGDNDLISIVARFQSADYTELSHNTISKTKGHYEYAGGVGVVRGRDAVWTCGQIDMGVTVDDDIEVRASDVKALLNAVADQVGCWPNN